MFRVKPANPRAAAAASERGKTYASMVLDSCSFANIMPSTPSAASGGDQSRAMVGKADAYIPGKVLL